MFVRRRQTLEVLSISALDIFASSLGVFVLIAIFLFPYYLKQPAREQQKLAAEAELSAAGEALTEAHQSIADAQAQRNAVDRALEQAQQRLRLAEQAAAAIEQDLAARPPEPESQSPQPEPQHQGLQPNRITIGNLDLMIVMDATGSMREELADLRANLIAMIRILHRLTPSLRIGVVAYKDRGDDFLTRVFPLSPMDSRHIREIVDFVGGIRASGGGDVPEPVDEALRLAVDMPWRDNAQGRIVVVGDAPVHPGNLQRAIGLADRFHASSPNARHTRRISTIFTGSDLTFANFFRSLARAGGGDFSFHQGRMIESVLLSVVPERSHAGAGR